MTDLEGRKLFLCLVILFSTSFADADLSILPDAFVPGVSKNVELTCLPPSYENILHVVILRMYRQTTDRIGSDPIATFVTNDTPKLETLGASLNASVSGFYDPSDPSSASLRVNLPRPTNEASGVYVCSAETLDSHDLLHRTDVYASLTSLALNKSVPVFYQTLLQELRNDLDQLTSDLSHVSDFYHFLADQDQEENKKISEINTDGDRIASLVSDVRTENSDVTQEFSTLETELDRLRDITPEAPVNFYAFLSTASISPGNGANIVFNALNEHTDNSYSPSTGVFTAPVNGTYRFLAGITGQAGAYAAAAITVNGQEVTSLFCYDDYTYKGATASAVVRLVVGDEVSVVKKFGAKIFGSVNGDHISYFLGLLLW